MDPYAGKKRITEAAKIKETVISELRQMGWRAPEGQAHEVKPKNKKNLSVICSAKVSTS